MRKLSVFLLIFMLCLLFVCSAAVADTEGTDQLTSGDYLYRIQDDGTALILRYNGSAEMVSVPAALDGIPVTALGANSFEWRTELMDITIPEGITSLGDYAFLYCKNLT